MNAEKYVIPEISCDADWFTLTGQDRIGTDLNKARIGKIPTPIPPVKPNQLLVSSFALSLLIYVQALAFKSFSESAGTEQL